MATDINLTTLFGVGVKPSRPNEGTFVDAQEFAFAGIDGSFLAVLGETGVRVTFQGLMRVVAASQVLAGTGMNTVKNNLLAFKRLGTVLNIIAGGTGMTAFEALYGITASNVTTAYRRMVVKEYNETSKRQFSREGANHVVLVEFSCVLQKVS